MGVSRIDSFKLLNVQTVNTTGANTATETLYLGPINGLMTLLASGGFGAGTLTFELYDGANWVPATGVTGLTAAGSIVWQGTALGVRAKLTGATNSTLTVVAVFVEY